MEDYAAKMQLKSDAALREYVTSYAQYRETAVLAALDELRRRGQSAPEEAALRPLLEPAAAAEAQAEATRQQAAAEAAAEAADEEALPTGPALYSPIAILFFSLFSPFPPLAGGVLLGLNLGFLKRWRALLGLVGVLALYGLGLWQLWRMGVSALTLELLKLPVILLYLLWFWPRYVAVKSFRSRSWLPPLLACLAVGFVMAWQLVHTIPGFADKTPEEKQEALQELLRQEQTK
jgi:hypothetical protein